MSRIHHISLLVLVVMSTTARAQSGEICGNGLDDNANNLTDEGCWNISSGQCESPLSCDETGSISPKRGTLRYSLPPDVAPKVPYGAGIGFRRSYLSQYEPGASAPVWKKPLGDHWHHTYMTWLAKTGTGSSGVVVLHTSQGQDVRAPWTSTDGTWDYFKPQAGYHVQYMRQRIASPNEYQIRHFLGLDARLQQRRSADRDLGPAEGDAEQGADRLRRQRPGLDGDGRLGQAASALQLFEQSAREPRVPDAVAD